MPRAEESTLETLQRYGILEEERSISGCKRICSGGHIQEMIQKWCWLIILSILYPIVYIIGYYSGFISNCICNGSM